MQPSGAKIIELDKIIKQKNGKCIFCSSTKELQYFRKQTVCLDCLNSVRYLFQNEYFDKETKGAN
ncbi:MAG: hypothetical protein GX434_08335 [Peptococcaceae bacterium]|nr:hypothetical protein [Peptococcaceae bacterium]